MRSIEIVKNMDSNRKAAADRVFCAWCEANELRMAQSWNDVGSYYINYKYTLWTINYIEDKNGTISLPFGWFFEPSELTAKLASITI